MTTNTTRLSRSAVADGEVWASTSDNTALPLTDGRQGQHSNATSTSWPQSIADARRCSPAVTAFLGQALAPNTLRAYRDDLRDFRTWGGTLPTTPSVLAEYLASRAAALSPHTLARRIVGIGQTHTLQGWPDPSKSELVRAVMRGIRRAKGTAQRRVEALYGQALADATRSEHDATAVRDRAVLLLGSATAFRRSELVALDVEDLAFVSQGLVVTQRRGKTDPWAAGRRIAVPTRPDALCAVQAVRDWLTFAQIHQGPVFRRMTRSGAVLPQRLAPQSIALVVKKRAAAAGLNPIDVSGHSLRAGYVTNAITQGFSLLRIQRQTGHRSIEMLARYVRDSTLFAPMQDDP